MCFGCQVLHEFEVQVGLIAARRTGRLRGTSQIRKED